MQVDYACLTDTVATLLEPDYVPNLKVIILGGEPISKFNLERQNRRIKLINIYSLAKYTIQLIANDNIQLDTSNNNISYRIGSIKTQIIYPKDYNILYPIGAVGELILEGALLARCYLGNLVRTAAAFITQLSRITNLDD